MSGSIPMTVLSSSASQLAGALDLRRDPHGHRTDITDPLLVELPTGCP